MVISLNYENQLTLISEHIIELSNIENQDKFQIIDEKFINNFNIYKSNLLYSFVNRFKIDFKQLYLYIPKENFTYLTRDFIKKKNITHAHYPDIAKKFTSYLLENQSIHNDNLIPYIASIDYAWAFGEILDLFKYIPSGLLEFWNQKENESVKIEINFEKMQLISVTEEDGERFLNLTQSSLFNN